MPLTTTLHQCEMDQPTGNAELDELLAAAKAATRRNYQVVLRPRYERKRTGIWYRMVQTGTDPCLYVEVPGVFPWQVMQCAQNEATVFAYLYGLVNGAHEHAPPNAGGNPRERSAAK